MSKLCGIEILLGSIYTAPSKRRGVHTIERQNQEPNPTGNISLTLDSKRQLVVFALHVLLSNKKSLEMALELITNQPSLISVARSLDDAVYTLPSKISLLHNFDTNIAP